jgi:GNAT superfamily N-acetyltransferase
VPTHDVSAALLAAVDANMRATYAADFTTTRDGFVIDGGGLLCCGTPHAGPVQNMAIVAGAPDAATVRAVTTHVFGAGAARCTVWTRGHADGLLERALAADRWFELTRVPGMVLYEADAVVPPRPAGAELHEVVDERGRAAYAAVAGAAWSLYGDAPAQTAAHFPSLASLRGPDRVAFVAWEAEVPVSCATSYLTGDDVAGIGWVATVPAAQGRGWGAAITWAAAHEAFRRGARLVNLQASPMGAPVYRRMGFATVTDYGVHVRPA